MARTISIIIPTRNRANMVQTLLNSLRELVGWITSSPKSLSEITISQDETPEVLHSIAKSFPVPLTLLKIQRRGKSAAMNEASRLADGNVLAFLDDDVVVQPNWLCTVQQFFEKKDYQAAQGVIRICPAGPKPWKPDSD